MQISAEAAASYFFALLLAVGAGRLRFWNLPSQQISEFGGKQMFDMEACGDRIRSLRRENEMTQEVMAERLNVSAYHFRRIENGKEGASIDLLIDIAELFGISLDYLILGRENAKDSLKKDLVDLAKRIRSIADEM